MDPAHSPLAPAFPVGSEVIIATRDELEEFRRTWRLHHPLAEAQLEHAGRRALVIATGMYHGGDFVYELSGTPGLLAPAESAQRKAAHPARWKAVS
jgi:hypothetical protein